MKPDPIATSLGRVLEAGWKPSEKGRDRTGHGGMKPEPCVLEDGSGRPERPAGNGPRLSAPQGRRLFSLAAWELWANSYPAIPAEHSRAPLLFRVASAGRVIRWEAETSRFHSHLLVVSVSQT